MEIKKGYKMTEIGLIPEGWEIVEIGEKFSFKNGLNKAKEFFGYGTPIINYMDVFNNSGIHRNHVKGKVFLTHQEKENYKVKSGDLLFTRTSETQSEIGMCSVLLEDIPNAVFSGFLLRARPKDKSFYNEFKKYCFHTNQIRRQIISTCSYTTRALTNGKLLSVIQVPIPTLQEQRAIATALSDMDTLLQSLNQLIAKKRAIKQGTMQELLKPKAGWEVKKLGDICEVFSGGTPNTSISEYYNGSINWIASGDLNKNFIYNVSGRISQKGYDNSSAKMVNKDTFLVAMYGATAGVCAITRIDGAINQAILAILPNKSFSSFFLYYNFKLRKDWIIKTYTQGGQPNLSGSIIKSIEFHFPDLKIQTAIAQILSDMDTEIETLEAQRAKYAAMKQGMMQELLTGKTRLI